ncbi:E3 ubiquitin-protein ligase NEDD4-like isoform X2 [Varroa jacobsoni]|uniref:HECT-type E3 ubiquitin transferase n=1 Tax=Varroa destructor TaxID=109461 RepID=A0A7M7L2J6_VARDE|nr:E3 ubiquitin-protein ligase NEDD4-like isoform X2 [Varroa destructor]XP_022688401.1 E3 ubiquitin-protein ligase NEDD4-like isoform X2 [Varroa jacobsoni]
MTMASMDALEVWPRGVEAPILAGAAVGNSTPTSPNSGANSFGTVETSAEPGSSGASKPAIVWDDIERTLVIQVLRGFNLAKKDIFGTSDPYVRISVLLNEQQVTALYTQTKKRTLNPQWDEEFRLIVSPVRHKVLVEVFDENRLTRDDFLGLVELPLPTIGVDTVPKHYILRPRSQKSRVRGHVQLVHYYLCDGERQNTAHNLGPVDGQNAIHGNAQLVQQQNVGRGDGINNNNNNNLIADRQADAEQVDLRIEDVRIDSLRDEVARDDHNYHHHHHVVSCEQGDEITSENQDPNESSRQASVDSTWEIISRNSVQGPLPPGWEERMDANGRNYYVNHILRYTQWRRPTLHEATDNSAAQTESQNCGGESAMSRASSSSVPAELQNSRGHDEIGRHRGSIGTFRQTLDSSGAGGGANGEAGGISTASSAGGQVSSPSHGDFGLAGLSLEPPEGNGSSGKSLRSSQGSEIPVGSAGASHGDEDSARSGAILDIVDSNVSSLSARRHEGLARSPELSYQSGSPVRSVRPTQSPGARAGSAGSLQNRVGCQQRVHISQEGRLTLDQSAGWQQAQLDTNGLPAGWSLQVAPNGRVFFIDHNTKTTTWTDPRTGKPSHIASPSGAPKGQGSTTGSTLTLNEKQHASASVDELGPLPDGWEERIHTDGRIFFIDHSNRRTQWEDPRFNNPELAGPAVPYSRDYKRKYEYFKSKLPKPPTTPSGGHAKLELRVTRSNIFEDAYMQVSSVTKTELLRTKLWVEFDSEEVLDYGGASREFFCLLSKEMFNPYYGLFEYSAADNYTLQVNPMSGVCNENHIPYFKFVGRIAGMAVYHGKLLEAFFIRPFYKMMLGKNIVLKDMESVDTEYFRSLMWIQDNDPEELDLRFSVDEDLFGQTQERELKPGGSSERVTQANKAEYIDLVISWRFVSRIQPQMNAFLEGFNEVVPLQLLKVFDESELELLMCGIGKIDVRDWHVNTLYKGGYHPNQLVIQWFWRLVLSFDNEMRARLLQFVTGTSRLPMNGFKELQGSNGPQQFTIEKWGNSSNLPRSHTCFNRIDLPPYESYQELRDKLIKAIEGSESFGGVD